MTPETARESVAWVLEADASVNASYVANGVVARAAEIAAIVVDLANQLEAVQTELAALKREVSARRLIEPPHEDRKEALPIV